MGAISDIVNVSITLQAVTPQQAGFGEVMIAAADCPAGFTERLRHYVGTGPTVLAQMVTDGFSVGNATYLAATAIMSQNPSPTGFAVGRLVHKPTIHFIITPTFVSGKTYKVTLDGLPASFVGITNLAATCTGIASAITALSVEGITADGSSGTTVTIACDDAGEWHRLTINDPTILSVVMDATDAGGSSGIADDLAGIALEDSTWYGVCLDSWGSAAIIAAAAAWVESNLKLMNVQTIDQPVADLPLASGSDIAQTLKSSAYKRSDVIYTHDNGNFIGAAWYGVNFPKAPGSENWAFSILAGVPPTNLTGTQITHLRSKYANFYYTVGGFNITQEGRVASGSYIDLTRGIDWLISIIQSNVLSVMITTGQKVPFTDVGIAKIEAALKASLTQAEIAGFLTPGLSSVSVPKAADVDAANKSNRILPNVDFTATAQGAVDKVNIVGAILL